MLRRKPSNASEKDQGQVQKKKLTLQRSSSFKDFMKPKPSSPAVNHDVPFDYPLPDCEDEEPTVKNSGKLGKKWRNVISRTMTRKTSKMVQKALAEEGVESGEENSMSPISPNDWTPDLSVGKRTSVCSNSSEDTMHPPLSRQLSGCGDRQSLDSGFSQRDSMDSPYNGPFCGRACVHTDFTPSPYDVDCLKLQKGDIIQIIEKPPVGTWTGKLNNRVGSFKFIYVTILPEEDTPPKRKRCHSHGQRKYPKPQTLGEVLARIELTELESLLSMHGFQSLEDFRGLKESHLNELNITDPEQRTKILTATELLHDSEDESGEEEDRVEEKSDMPRDSGCYESTENLVDGREEVETDPSTERDVKTDVEEGVEAVQEQMQELTVDEES